MEHKNYYTSVYKLKMSLFFLKKHIESEGNLINEAKIIDALHNDQE
jgi:hypothetical protein